MNMARPKVSIIMGIYNCEQTIEAAIQSVVLQTYSNWELIMCDDASTDSTYQIASFYEKKYPGQIIVLKNEQNLRLAATLNRCLKVATGKYVARMDSDDISMSERLEKEVLFLETHQEFDCVGTNVIIFDENGERGIRRWREYPVRNSLVKGVPFAHPTIMMRKSVYDDLKGYTVSRDTMRAEDADLWFRFFAKGYEGYVIQEALYKYRESKNDYKKRSIKAAVGTMRIYIKGFKMLNYSKYKYIYAMKPIVSACLPNGLMFFYHKLIDRLGK